MLRRPALFPLTKARAALVALVALLVGLPRLSLSAEPAKVSPKLAAELRQALEMGESSQVDVRNAALAALRQRSDDFGPAHWYSGEVQIGKRWVKYDKVAEDPERQATLAEYEQAREKAFANGGGGHRQLADWCARHALTDRERFHLFSALQKDPDDQPLRTRLGFVLRNIGWLHPVDVAAYVERQRAQAQAWATWSQPIRQTAMLLPKGDTQECRDAIARFRKITDPSAIPAMRALLYPSSSEGADLVIEQLGRIKSPEAAYCLCELALFNTLASREVAAAKQLRGRPEDCYVPLLLSALSSLIEHRHEYYESPNGEVVSRHLFVRELEDRKVELKQTTKFTDAKEDLRVPVTPAEQQKAQAAGIEFQVERQNLALQQANERVYEVLALGTGEEVPKDPKACWNWWYERNEVYVTTYKPVETRTETSTVVLNQSPVRKYDCLAAGTPIWTDRGLIAVDKIGQGDRVLAQNPQTGELAYKIVYGTTVRPPETLVEIETNRGKLTASGGHPFWVGGKGWVRARLLPAGARLHGLGDDVRVVGVTSGTNSQPSYNLLVADFHTYFAGDQKVLSHDNTIRQPIVATWPGVLEQ